MFHSNKKKEKKELTEEELKKIEEKLEKIKAIQNRIIKMRKDNEKDINNLEFILKAGILMPDFGTMWSYRKELILHHQTVVPENEFYRFLSKEIENISGIMLKNPKSYVLWYHRIWCLKILSEIEQRIAKALTESSLMKEIYLCNKFLEKDERNFHVWNYRLTIFKMIHQFFKNKFFDFLTEELDFTLKMIKKSFSNFSAWHYRSKLITLDLVNKNILWSSPQILEYFKDDLFYLKNAMFTDPRDQSPWNYYHWIISNICPIYIKTLSTSSMSPSDIDELIINIQYSQKMPLNDLIEIKIINLKNEVETFKVTDLSIQNDLTNDDSNTDYFEAYDDTIKIDFNIIFNQLQNKNSLGVNIEEKLKKLSLSDTNSNDPLKITIGPKDLDNLSSLFSQESLSFSNKLVPLKNNIDLPKIVLTLNKMGITGIETEKSSNESNNNYDHLVEFFKSQLLFIDDLIKNTDGFIEMAHFRKVQILIAQSYLRFETQNKKIVNDELNLLIEKSKRMKEIYRNILEAL